MEVSVEEIWQDLGVKSVNDSCGEYTAHYCTL